MIAPPSATAHRALRATGLAPSAERGALRMIQVLGWRSSHPRFERRRLLLWFSVACAPIALAVAVFLLIVAVVGAARATTMLLGNANIVILYGLGTMGFALALGLTAALSIRASRCKMLVDDEKAPGHASQLGFLGILLAFLAAGAISWIAPIAFSAAPRMRVFLAFLSIVPLAFVVGVIFWLPTQPTNGRRASRAGKWWILLPALGLLLYGATWLQSVAVWLSRSPLVDQLVRIVAEFSPRMAQTLDPERIATVGWIVIGLSTIVLAPLLAMVVVAVALLRDARDEAAEPDSRAQSLRSEQTELLLGEKPLTRSSPAPTTLGLPGAQPGAESSISMRGENPLVVPSEVAEALGRLKSAVSELIVADSWSPQQVALKDSAELEGGNDPLDRFFAGIRPSVDQAAAFRAIQTAYDDTCSSELPIGQRPSCDALVLGPSGSGRSSVLAAAVVRGVVVRGHTALIIVPNELKAMAMARRVRAAAVACGVGHFIEVRHMQAGCDPRASGGAEPDVLISTLADLESYFFGTSAGFDELRARLLRLQFVAVDDLDRIDGPARLHLPFFLQRLRILLASEGLACQTVVATRSLGPASAELLGERLLWGSGVARHLWLKHFKRPAGSSEPIHVPLRARGPGTQQIWQVLDKLAEAAVQLRMDAFLFVPGIPTAEATRMEDRYRRDGERAVRVVTDLDDLEGEDAARWRGVFYAASDGVSANLALRARATASEVVLVSVRPAANETLEDPSNAVLPLVLSNQGDSMLSQHWTSLARFLRPRMPVPLEFWARLGLRAPDQFNGLSSLAGVSMTRDRLRSLRVDVVRGDSSVSSEARWNWVALVPGEVATNSNGDAQPPAAVPVAIDGLPDARLTVSRTDRGDELEIVRRAEVVESQSRVMKIEWVNEQGERLGESDVSVGNSFHLAVSGQRYYPLSLSKSSSTSTVQIRAAAWDEKRRGQAAYPLWRITELSLPQRANLGSRATGPLQSMISCFDVFGEQGDRFAECQVRLQLAGLYGPAGDVQALSVDFAYACSVSILVLGEGGSDEGESLLSALNEATSAFKINDARWNTELSAAFTAALRKHIPMLEDFVRCPCFQLPNADGAGERFAILLIEPVRTAGTAAGLISRLLREESVVGDFAASLSAFLDESGSGPSRAELLFSRAGSAFHAQTKAGLLVTNADSLARARASAMALERLVERRIGSPDHH
jgi:hypothetical protein